MQTKIGAYPLTKNKKQNEKNFYCRFVTNRA